MESRNLYFDFLRGIAIIGVIAIHTYSLPSDFDSLNILLRQILNCCVPIFFFISGFFLYNKKIDSRADYSKFIVKQGGKVYLPMLFWSLPYLILSLYDNSSPVVSVVRFFAGGFSVYYFVTVIMQCYITLPILKRCTNNLGLLLSLAVTTLSLVGLYYLSYIKSVDLPLLLRVGWLPIWVVFFVLGLYVRKNQEAVNKKRKLILYSSMCGILIFLTMSYIETQKISTLVNAVGGVGIKMSAALYSLSIIMFLYVLKDYYKTNVVTKMFVSLGDASFSMYLIHKLLMLFFFENFAFYHNIGWGLKTILVVILSFVVSVVMKILLPVRVHRYLGL